MTEETIRIGKHLYNAEEIIEKIFVPRGIVPIQEQYPVETEEESETTEE